MLPRVLEIEVMDTPEEAHDYDAMDHASVNRVFVADFLAVFLPTCNASKSQQILDLGTGTAQIPIELCRQFAAAQVVAVDLAENMLQLARANVKRAGLTASITVERCDAKSLAYADGQFAALISNSIVHHIPEPARVIAEMIRVVRPGGVIFVRDLLRPNDDATVSHLVRTYAGNANRHQQQMFDDSLRAALTLDEIRELIVRAGMNAAEATQTTDRHWTWSARKPAAC